MGSINNQDDDRVDNVQEAPGMEVDIVEEADGDLKAIMAVMRRNEKVEIQEANAEMMAVIRSLGGDHHRYGRERGGKR